MKRIMTALWAVLLFATICESATANPASNRNLRFCLKWEAQFEDSMFDEDVYNTTKGVFATGVMYAKVKFSIDTNTYVYYTDEQGCINTSVELGKEYKIRVYTQLVRGNRKITILADGHGWKSSPFNSSKWVNYFEFDKTFQAFQTTPDQDYGTLTYDQVVSLDSHGRLMPAFSKLLEKSNTLDYPPGSDTRVSIDKNLCVNEKGNYVGSACMGSEDTNYRGESIDPFYRLCISIGHLDNKFVQAHEFGHVISKMNNGPRRGSYEGDSQDSSITAFADTQYGDQCNGTSINGANATSHCLTSREYIGSASKEGFSHFVASVAFNNRTMNTGDGGFAYYKKVRRSKDDPPGAPYSPPCKVNISPDTDADYEIWMENECKPDPDDGYKDLGTEWDWLQFFWVLYAQGDERYDVYEINDVWDNVDALFKLDAMELFLAKLLGKTEGSEDRNNRYCKRLMYYPQPTSSPVLKMTRDCVYGPYRPEEDQVRKGVSFGKSWSDLVASAKDIYGENSAKADNFEDIGKNAGINY